MFQAEPVLWMQSFASPALTWLMGWATQLGYTPVYVGLVLLLAFAVRLRPALAILLALLLAGIATHGLKSGIAFPRPSHVEESVTRPGKSLPLPVAPRSAATGFWSLPTAEARAEFRARPGSSYGFPSGHVSAAAAFCLGLATFFRWRAALVLAITWPLLMGASRVFLGRHFLADVIGGWVVGVLAVVSARLLLRWWEGTAELPQRRHRINLAAVGAIVIAGVSIALPWLDPENAGRLLGLILAYALLESAGFPSDAGVWYRRAARFLGAVLIYLVVSRALDRVLEAAALDGHRLAVLVGAALTVAITLVGSVFLGRLTRTYVAA